MRRLLCDLVDQFMISQSPEHVPQGWRVRVDGSWVLASHPRLPVMEIYASTGSHVGWLLGYPIDQAGHLLTSSWRMPGALPNVGPTAHFEQSLYALIGGRFAALYVGSGASRVYLDPCGTLSVVYCAEQRVAASSPNLVPPSEGTGEDQALVRAVGVPDRDGWYAFGLTPRRGIERLLPNHYLDLETWNPHRHWPTRASLAVNSETAEAVSEIAAILERQIAAVVQYSPAYMSLTAGRHTRMMLACARPFLDRIAFFTIPIARDRHASLDCSVARRVAKRCGLQYVSLRWEKATTADLDEWMYRTGACVAGQTWHTVRTLRQLDSRRSIMSGIVGAVGHGTCRKEHDFQTPGFSPAELVSRIGMPAVPEMLARAERWVNGLPVEALPWTIDLLHWEQKYGSWAGPQEYGHVDNAFLICPYSHQRIAQLMLELPSEYRWRNRLVTDLITQRWPELLDLPINRPLGLRRGLVVSERLWRGATQRVFQFATRRGSRTISRST